MCRPDLTVYLDARDDVLLDRIRRRNRPYEASIDTGYLDALRDAYASHHQSTGRVQVLTVDTSVLDLRSESHLRSLFEKILTAAARL